MLLLHSWPGCGRPRQWIFPKQWGWVMSDEHNQLIIIASHQLSLRSWGWLCGLSHHCLPPWKKVLRWEGNMNVSGRLLFLRGSRYWALTGLETHFMNGADLKLKIVSVYECWNFKGLCHHAQPSLWFLLYILFFLLRHVNLAFQKAIPFYTDISSFLNKLVHNIAHL